MIPGRSLPPSHLKNPPPARHGVAQVKLDGPEHGVARAHRQRLRYRVRVRPTPDQPVQGGEGTRDAQKKQKAVATSQGKNFFPLAEGVPRAAVIE